MADEKNSPMVIGDTSPQFGGLGSGLGALGGGAIGLVIGSALNGGWGFGGNRGVADATMANALEHVSDQVTQGNLAMQQLASNQNMFMGNMLNGIGDAITAAVNQGTITSLSNTQALGDKLCGINHNITVQGYESRLQAQELVNKVQENCNRLSREIFEQGCANRELQRQIQTEAISGALADAKATIASLQEQIMFANSQAAQTAQILAAINAKAAPSA